MWQGLNIPLPDSLGEIKLGGGQVDFANFLFQIWYNLYWKLQYFGCCANENFGYVKPFIVYTSRQDKMVIEMH